jgi:hypothetical protein
LIDVLACFFLIPNPNNKKYFSSCSFYFFVLLAFVAACYWRLILRQFKTQQQGADRKESVLNVNAVFPFTFFLL